jgi:membrane protein YqaA with SNARE-associated domain
METFAATLDQAVRELSRSTAGFGLFVVAFFDSSLLSLPEVNDLLLVYFSAKFPARAYFYALMTVAGSVLGASSLYALARWKGYNLLQKRYSRGRLSSAFGLVQRYGMLAVIVPAMLPPPLPFKIFVLSAGALGLSVPRFVAAVLVGRVFRYFGQAFLAVRYGESAGLFLKAHAVPAAVAGAAVVALVVAVHFLLERQKRKRSGRDESRLDARPLEP